MSDHPAIKLLQSLISIPSFSREEKGTADTLESFLHSKKIKPFRHLNNVWAQNKHFDPEKPSFLFNSHHDTVKPNSGYTRDPFMASIEDGKLYGLGSNDAGGCVVAQIFTFLHFYEREDLVLNLIWSGTAEEEISGDNGILSIIPQLKNISGAIAGEPTQMHMAVAEKGLLVLNCTAHGKAGHAAREEGDNAIYKAMKDIEWFSSFKFPKVSKFLGPVKMNVTIINSGSQHNVIPEKCDFTVDIRVNDCYTHEEVLDIIKANVKSEVNPKSTRLRSTSISEEHYLVKSAELLKMEMFGSPACSDQALMPWPSVKIGPGFSGRSHTANEFIYVNEVLEGIEIYTKLLEQFILSTSPLSTKKHETLGKVS